MIRLLSLYWRKILFSKCGFCSSFASFPEDGGRIFEHLGQDCTAVLLLLLHIGVLPLKSKTFEMQAAGTRPVTRAGAVEGKGAPHPGRVQPSLWLPEPLRLGKTQNAGTTESALLWRTRKLEPHSTQGPLHIEQPGA